jgi:V8-like Glu-specific endopeptidase
MSIGSMAPAAKWMRSKPNPSAAAATSHQGHKMAFTPSAFSNVLSFNFRDSVGRGSATGFIIGKHAILTVAHAVDGGRDHLSPSKIGFGPTAATDTISTLSGLQTQVLMTGRSFTDYAANDYAVIAVSADLTKIGAPMTLGKPTAGTSVHVTGYPTSVRGGTQQDVIVKIDSVSSKGVISYQDSDVTFGNSGSPLWFGENSNATAVGFHSASSLSSNERLAGAIQGDALANIQRWSAQADALFKFGNVSVSADQNAPGLVSRIQIDDPSIRSYSGTDLRDRYVAGTTAATYDGGNGYDTVVFSQGKRADYKIANVATSASGVSATVTLPNGAVTKVNNTERLEFTDGVVMFGSASPISVAIADQLSVVYFGRGMSEEYRDKIAVSLTSGVTLATTGSLFYAGIADRAFNINDSLQTIANKTFLNIFGINASQFEQDAWANAVNVGAVTKEHLPWTMFVSYLSANNVPRSYQEPAQSRIVAAHAFTEGVNGVVANSLGTPGAAKAEAARAWLQPIRTQQDAGMKVLDASRAVQEFSGSAAVNAVDTGVFINDVNYGLVGIPTIA